MLLIPELETVVILVPRTGSGSLKRAVLQRWPRAMLIYRHMEADGIPAGYDRWHKVGVVRHPIARLWSLYKFLRDHYHKSESAKKYPDHHAEQHASALRPFEDWLLRNQTVFTCPHDGANRGRFWPQFNVLHALPENRKSQWVYLRPDLGTEVVQFNRLGSLAARLGVVLPRENGTDSAEWPPLSAEAHAYLRQVFDWDFRAAGAPAIPRYIPEAPRQDYGAPVPDAGSEVFGAGGGRQVLPRAHAE